MARKDEYTAAEVIKALRASHGIKASAAKILGCHWNTVHRYCETYPTVRRVLDEEWEVNVDFAESKLLKQVDAGYMPAINKVLNEKGRHRGWGKAEQGTEDNPIHLTIRGVDFNLSGDDSNIPADT